MSKLTRGESELVSALRDSYERYYNSEVKISDMQAMIGKSYSMIYKMLHGYMSHGSQYSGLLDKCPAISFLDRIDVSENGDTSKRSKVYVWNHDLYMSWASGGGCWLDKSDNDHDEDPNGGNHGFIAEK